MTRNAKRICLAAAVAALLAACSVEPSPRVIGISNGPEPAAGELEQNIGNLLQRTSPAYVTLVVHDTTHSVSRMPKDPGDAVTSGSGFVIDRAGHVLTAGHVAVSAGWRVRAHGQDGRTYRGHVVDILKSSDIALVRLERMGDVRPVEPAQEPCLALGEPVFSLGKPRRRGDTARLGHVASMSFGQPVSYQSFGYPDAMVLRMQTRKGESGGPVFNSRGELVGMLVSTLSDGVGNPLDLAHAVTAPMLARFVCDRLECSPAWRALASRDTAQCPGKRSTPGHTMPRPIEMDVAHPLPVPRS